MKSYRKSLKKCGENSILGTNKKNNNNQSQKKDEKRGPNILDTEIDGFKVLIGKNNKQNDYITTKLGKANDIWFHTQKIQGSHVLLKTENKIPLDSTLEKCAKLAAKYSRAKNSSNVPVDYTFVRYVRKPSGSKAGQVIYTDQKTIYVNP